MNPYEVTFPETIGAQNEDTRAQFVRKTYGHLAAAIAVFAVIEYILLHAGLENAVFSFLSAGRFSWLMVLGGFMAISWMAF